MIGNPSHQKKRGPFPLLEAGLLNLSSQMLSAFRIATLVFVLIKVLEHMQIIYFLMRAIGSYHWDFSFFVFVSVFLNFISIDQLFRSNPQLFRPIFYSLLVLVVLVLVMGVVVAIFSGWGKKPPFIIRIFAQILCYFCYLQKTVLFIPLHTIAFISILPAAASGLNIEPPSSLEMALGFLLTFLIVLLELLFLTFFRQANPFCQLPFAGQTFFKGLIWSLFRVALVMYGLLDPQGQHQLPATMSITGTLLLLIVYSHWEVGLYKMFSKGVEVHLLYVCFTVGLLHSSDFSGGEITTVAYLLPLNLLTYLGCKWILEWQNKILLTLRFRDIDQFKILERQILYLIYLIENFHLRENKIALEGFVAMHRRDCNIGDTCGCWGVDFSSADEEEHMAQIKLDCFNLLLSLLESFRQKFPEERKVNTFIGMLQFFKTGNWAQSNYAVRRIVSKKEGNVIDRLYENYYLQMIEHEMQEDDNKDKTRFAQINRYYHYTNREVQFQSTLEKCSKFHIQFWKLMLDKNPDIRSVQETGSQVTRSKEIAKAEFERMCDLNKNSVRLFTLYGRFLLEVTNEDRANVKYLQLADTILKNSKNGCKDSDLATKYQFSSNTAYVAISGDEERPGIIVHTNNLAKDYLGYSRSQVVGQNVKVIMPKIFADQHDRNVRRYMTSSKCKTKGQELIVPGLHREGYIVPITALIKVIPSLQEGIRIATFIGKFREDLEDDQTVRSVNYLLYRTDTEEVMGITQGIINHFGIPACLIYGHPLNNNQQLHIARLFGVSFEKEENGRLAQAMEEEVKMVMNTKGLHNDFYINKGSTKTELMEVENPMEEEEPQRGVELAVYVKKMLELNYYGTPLKLVGIYDRRVGTSKERRVSIMEKILNLKPEAREEQREGQLLQDDPNKNQSEQTIAQLKDFKYLISQKRQPKAISSMNCICSLFLLVFLGSVIGLIFNFQAAVTTNTNILAIFKLNLEIEMATSEVLSLMNMNVYRTTRPGITGLTPLITTQQEILTISTLAKQWQVEILPLKYFFQPDYNFLMTQYSIVPTGAIHSQRKLIEEAINNYFTQFQMMQTSNSSLLVTMTPSERLMSNVFIKQRAMHLNQPYSIRPALNQTSSISHQWFQEKIAERRKVVVIMNVLLMATVILWAACLLPYALSVSRISNRVLSLFTLIPTQEVYRLIYDCMRYMNQNLKEALVDQEDFNLYEGQQSKYNNKASLLDESNSGSPTQLNLLISADFSQGYMRKGYQAGNEDSVVDVVERFDRMVNSEDDHKKTTICKYVLISLLLLSFVIFYLVFSLSLLWINEAAAQNYQLVGRRASLIRQSRTLLSQYMLNPASQFTGHAPISTLCQDMIQEFYTLEANLLSMDLRANSDFFNSLNDGDVCSQVPSFASSSVFNQSFNSSECNSIRSGIFQKGVKTSVINFLQDLRAVLSQYPSLVPTAVISAKIMESQLMTKYIETPMLAVQAQIWDSLTSSMNSTFLVIILAGAIFLVTILITWRLVWGPYLQSINTKIWRTKGLLNLIPIRLVKNNNRLKGQFTSGNLQNALK